jgi:hypothetical protein
MTILENRLATERNPELHALGALSSESEKSKPIFHHSSIP